MTKARSTRVGASSIPRKQNCRRWEKISLKSGRCSFHSNLSFSRMNRGAQPLLSAGDRQYGNRRDWDSSGTENSIEGKRIKINSTKRLIVPSLIGSHTAYKAECHNMHLAFGKVVNRI